MQSLTLRGQEAGNALRLVITAKRDDGLSVYNGPFTVLVRVGQGSEETHQVTLASFEHAMYIHDWLVEELVCLVRNELTGDICGLHWVAGGVTARYSVGHPPCKGVTTIWWELTGVEVDVPLLLADRVTPQREQWVQSPPDLNLGLTPDWVEVALITNDVDEWYRYAFVMVLGSDTGAAIRVLTKPGEVGYYYLMTPVASVVAVKEAISQRLSLLCQFERQTSVLRGQPVRDPGGYFGLRLLPL